MSQNRYVELFKNLIDGKYGNSDLQKIAIFDAENQFIEPARIVAEQFKYPPVDDTTLKHYFQVAWSEYLSTHPIVIEPMSALSKNQISWLSEERKSAIEWAYTTRYLRYLKAIGRTDAILTELDSSSLEIIGKLGDPTSNVAFYIKGLVVGEVQSGKTGNFNAVINRAIDVGYKLVIVLSGIMEDLRRQTQQRIDNDIIGEGFDIETGKIGPKGVGRILQFGSHGNSKIEQVRTPTSHISDFNRARADADFSLNAINVLVCKKNTSVLRNLLIWLSDHLDHHANGKHTMPLLVIDDEADNASLNNEGSKGREYASKINGDIRALLGLFHRKSYLGYTATPFANVLQDRNDLPERNWPIKRKVNGEVQELPFSRVDNLFPDDFVVLLSPPSNYIGAKQIFETIQPINNEKESKIPLVVTVSDHSVEFPARLRSATGIPVEVIATKEEWDDRILNGGAALGFSSYAEYQANTRSSKKDDNFPRALPQSLKDALICFLLTIAVRQSRQPKIGKSALVQPHNSMLIHVSRFTKWQNQTKDLIQVYLDELIQGIHNDKPSSADSVYAAIRIIWEKYYASIIENIKGYLPKGYEDDFLVPIVFDSLKNFLPEACNGLEVKAINSVTGDKLEYPNNKPKKVVAIGGNRLSRGFTLEGLSINYFVRATNYSDTLLQMGRWFGYRPGFIDCCKLFTPQDSIDKYDSTTRCVEELESEFRKMANQNKTPRQFALRVRKHPGTLKITRPSILKGTKEVKWSYQDQLEMTTQFDVSKRKIQSVWDNFTKSIAPLFSGRKADRREFLLADVSAGKIIEILQSANNFDQITADSMAKFIELCIEKGKLTNWTVAVKTNGQGRPVDSGVTHLPIEVKSAIRRGPRGDGIDHFIAKKIFKATGKSANIMSASLDMAITLTESEIANAESAFRTHLALKLRNKDKYLSESDALEKALKATVPERVYRERIKETQGLLVIYLLDSLYAFSQDDEKEPAIANFVRDEGIDLNTPLIGYAVGFPPIEDDPGGIYSIADIELEEEDSPELQQPEAEIDIPEDALDLENAVI